MRNTTPTRAAVLVLALVLGAAVAPLLATTADAQLASRDATLAIDQPAYVDSEVKQTSINGTRAYVVKGEEIDIRPQNFRSSDVLDYGVDAPAGTLTFDEAMQEYTFSPEGETGTFELYWTVTEQRVVNNTQGNQTVQTTTNVSVRYSAVVRVDGKTQMTHVVAGTIAGLRQQAANWEEFNATVQDVREMNLLAFAFGSPPSTEQVVQGMVNTYIATRDPIRGLFSGSEIMILLVTSMFGLFLLVSNFGAFAALLLKTYRRLFFFESIEAEEGAIRDRVAELDDQQRRMRFADLDWVDWFNDHVADLFKRLGATPAEGYDALSNGVLQPRTWVRDRLQAMSQCGYAARVERRTVTDGGDEEEPSEVITDAEVIAIPLELGPNEEFADRDDLVSLAHPDDELLDALDWEDEYIRNFDLVGEDIDASKLDTEPTTLDLDELLAAVELQTRRFEDTETAGQYLREYLESVRAHPITDAEGRPRTTREMANRLLTIVRRARDEHDIPLADYQVQAVERALLDDDPGERADKHLSDLRSGRDAD